MRIGAALFVIAVGAILDFAVSVKTTHGFNIHTIGLILMVVGIIGIVAEFIFMSVRRRTDVVHSSPAGTTRTTYAEPPADPRY